MWRPFSRLIFGPRVDFLGSCPGPQCPMLLVPALEYLPTLISLPGCPAMVASTSCFLLFLFWLSKIQVCCCILFSFFHFLSFPLLLDFPVFLFPVSQFLTFWTFRMSHLCLIYIKWRLSHTLEGMGNFSYAAYQGLIFPTITPSCWDIYLQRKWACFKTVRSEDLSWIFCKFTLLGVIWGFPCPLVVQFDTGKIWGPKEMPFLIHQTNKYSPSTFTHIKAPNLKIP